MPNVGLWNQSDLQPVAEVPSIPRPPTAVQEGHGNHTTSVSPSACVPGHNATPWDSHTAFDPSKTSWSASSDRQLPLPLINQERGTLHPFLDQSHAHPSHACASHATHPHYPSSEPSIPRHTPSYQSFSPTSLHLSPYPAPTGFLETFSRPFYRVPDRSSSRRKRAARAIEYDGLWIDEEELLKALMEFDGKITVHQCRWEEHHLPCHLWIRGDKSHINAHIQKWHRGKPGGDKIRVDCRWSACGKNTMKESIARQIINIHLGETWECQGCGTGIVRSDAYGRHAERSEFDLCRTSGR
ncbi:hypothetical protein OG21DRAFT_135466 [Imleria badia]|nr:hypothetical protein OG21DRAFT_135466 [Imleria badia]